MKSVLMLTCQYMPDVFGGAEKQCRRVSTELAKRGYQVTILTSRQKLSTPSVAIEDGVKIIRIFTPIGPDLLGRWLPISFYWFFRTLSWLTIRQKTFDIIHCHQGKFGAFVGAFHGKLFHKPVIIKIGNSEQHMDLRCLKRKAIVGKLMTQYTLAARPTFVAISNVIKHNLIEFGCKDLVTISNGISTEFSQYRQTKKRGKPSNIQFFYHGRIEAIKRIDILIEAFSQASQKINNSVLHIVGDGSCLAAAKQQALKYDLQDQIVFHGKIEDVIPLISTFDIFVNASEAEGFSNSLLEALLLAKILVSTPVSGASEAIFQGENGFIAENFDAKALTHAILESTKLLTSTDSVISRTEQLLTTKFSMPVVVDQYEKLYENLLQSKSHEMDESQKRVRSGAVK